MTVWWVNQGQSYAQQRDAGILWAPAATRDGRSTRKYWTALNDLQLGDEVIHYAKGHLVAVSLVLSTAVTAPRPVDLPDDLWEVDGYLVECRYAELSPPLRLDEVPLADRQAEPREGPFERPGSVKMGYLFPLSETLAQKVLQECRPRLRAPGPGIDHKPLPPEAQDGAAALLRRLIGIELKTPSGRSNMIVGIDSTSAWVATDRSPDGRAVPIEDIASALSTLRRAGAVTVTPQDLGYRSTFVATVLLTLPGTMLRGSPPQIILGNLPEGADTPVIPFGGELDQQRSHLTRGEQTALRQALMGTAAHRHCALCGIELPVRYLVAAHIKRRSVCSERERRDLAHIAMPACLFGCDILFETGAISVDEDGRIIAAQDLSAHLQLFVARTLGKRCLAYSPSTAAYFEWHRLNVFQGRGQTPLPRSAVWERMRADP
jgi:hypothetical protein